MNTLTLNLQFARQYNKLRVWFKTSLLEEILSIDSFEELLQKKIKIYHENATISLGLLNRCFVRFST